MKLSIVTSMYKSAPYVREFCRRAAVSAQAMTDDYEIILVDDGSPDDSYAMAREAQAADPRVTIVQLARNYGQHKALLTGLAHTDGDLVFMLDCDLEEPPEWLADFHKTMLDKDADVVFGVQEQRKGGFFERVSGQIFYSLFSRLASINVPVNQATARLMTAEYVRALVEHQDREVYLAGLCWITGFRQVSLTVTKLSKGSTSYSLSRKLTMAVDSIVAFSTAPLRYIFFLGLMIMVLSAGYAFFALLQWLIRGGDVRAGWTSLIVSVWFLGGVIIFTQAILALYLSKIQSEVKRRPYTVVRRLLRGEAVQVMKPRPARQVDDEVA